MHQRHYSEVVAACRTALGVDPSHVDLRLLLAESLMSLRRDAEAQAEVAVALRERPRCPEAYRLLGELAFRRDELRAAEIFLREALRVAPGDRSSYELLELVKSRKTPAAAAAKLPAASAAAGTSSMPLSAMPRPRARGTEPAPTFERPESRDGRRASHDDARNVPLPIFATGSSSVDTGSVDVDMDMDFDSVTTADAAATEIDDSLLEDGATMERPRPDFDNALSAVERPPWFKEVDDPEEPTAGNAARVSEVESVVLRLNQGITGFGEYLVLMGALTRSQLFQVLRIQDWERLRLGEAAVRLGYISERRVAKLLRRYLATFDETLMEGADASY